MYSVDTDIKNCFDGTGNPISWNEASHYYCYNFKSFNNRQEYTYRFYHSGYEYCKEVLQQDSPNANTIKQKNEYLNAPDWDNYNTRMSNQTIKFIKATVPGPTSSGISPSGPAGSTEIGDRNDLEAIITGAFNLSSNDLSFDFEGITKNKLQAILDVVQLVIKPYRRFDEITSSDPGYSVRKNEMNYMKINSTDYTWPSQLITHTIT